MYDELIRNLRNESKYALPSQTRKALIDAADAIEEMQQQVDHYHGCMNDWYEMACDYKTMVEQMKATVIVEAQHTEMFDERDKKTLLEMAKSLPLTLAPLQHCNALDNDKMRWIPVTERLPEENDRYLVVLKRYGFVDDIKLNDEEIRILRYHDEWRLPCHIPKWINDTLKQEVTYWMPLPEPPKEEAQ
jgi:hypothetical protein